MLQRSPTYIISLPATDRLARWLDRALPSELAYTVARWKNVAQGMAFYKASRRFPRLVKRLMVAGTRRSLGPNVDVERHFTPTYKPWDQRLCVAADGDFFAAIKSGRADVVTDHIERFTETGLALRSGAHLDADLVVTATGLELRLLGGVKLAVDGRPLELGKTLMYKGTLLRDVPNLAVAVGYTNMSWTLKCDLTSEYACRLIRYMDDKGHRTFVPRLEDANMPDEPVIDLTSGYIQRARAELPRQGAKAPWRLTQNYFVDLFGLKYGDVDDGVIAFG
jgi:cation diffusion facilitator CzcD-associated flavoprotein CzcO